MGQRKKRRKIWYNSSIFLWVGISTESQVDREIKKVVDLFVGRTPPLILK